MAKTYSFIYIIFAIGLTINLFRQWNNTNKSFIRTNIQQQHQPVLSSSSISLSNTNAANNNIKNNEDLAYIQSKPGMIFSHDRLVFNLDQNLISLLYSFSLTQQPTHNVTILIHDPSGCTTQISHLPILKINILPEQYNIPIHVRASLLNTLDKNQECEQGLIHAIKSKDENFNGIHVRIFIDIITSNHHNNNNGLLQSSSSQNEQSNNNNNNDNEGDERTGEWIPEEILGAEEGPARALAPIERSRSAYHFITSSFKCRDYQFPLGLATTTITTTNKLHKRLVCFLAVGTPFETPFYVIDPVGGLDEDGWNGFPVVMMTGGIHGSEPAGAVAAHIIAKTWIPRRGRFVIVPFVNIRGLKQGTRSIPGVSSSRMSDLNRDFPQDGSPLGDLASDIWRLAQAIRPDMFFDFHEGWGVFSQLKGNPHDRLVNSKTFSKGSSVISTVDAVPIAETMIQDVNRNLSPDRLFELIVQPIAGGLAAKLGQAFKTRAIVTETTKDQSLDIRVRQHITMLKAALTATDVVSLSSSLNNNNDFPSSRSSSSGIITTTTSYCMPVPVSDVKLKDSELCL
jgi:hypothetical protein